MRVALFSGNYNYLRDGANQALNRLVSYAEQKGVKYRVYSPVTDTPAFEPAGDLVAIRRGWWKPKMTLLPHASVQSVDLKTDFLLRPLGLATLVFGVPGGSSLASHEIPAIPLDAAQQLRTRILAAGARA